MGGPSLLVISQGGATRETYDTPCALDTKLDAERASSKRRERPGDDPERNKATDQENEQQHGEATAEVLRDEPSNSATCDGTAVPDDSGLGGKL